MIPRQPAMKFIFHNFPDRKRIMKFPVPKTQLQENTRFELERLNKIFKGLFIFHSKSIKHSSRTFDRSRQKDVSRKMC